MSAEEPEPNLGEASLNKLTQEEKELQVNQLRDMSKQYKEEYVKDLEKKLKDMTILIHQVLEQDESDFFEDNVRTIERQNIRRMLKARFPLTPEMVEIVNKSKEQQQQNSIS